MFYETFDFKVEINHGCGLSFAPRICVQLWDEDDGLDGDDYIACCMLDLKESFVDASKDMDELTIGSSVLKSLPPDLPTSCRKLDVKKRLDYKTLPDPIWKKFMIEKEGDVTGTMLASVQLIPSSPGHSISVPHIPIFPEGRPAWLELTTLGCRNLIPHGGLPILFPHVEYSLETAEDGEVRQSTSESKKPSPQNPNFLRYDVVEIKKFPMKALFAPRLMVTAFDNRGLFGGKVDIGSACYHLEDEVPWDSSYRKKD
jgi:hypothetical protein